MCHDIHVKCMRRREKTAFEDRRRCSVTHDGLEETRWPATPPPSDGSPPDRSDQRPEVGRDVLLREGRGLSCQSVSTLVARQAAVGRYPL